MIHWDWGWRILRQRMLGCSGWPCLVTYVTSCTHVWSQNRAALPVVERTAVVERTLPSSGEGLAACAVVERTPAPDGGGARHLRGGRA